MSVSHFDSASQLALTKCLDKLLRCAFARMRLGMNWGYLFGLVGLATAITLEAQGQQVAAYTAFGLTCLAALFGLVHG